MCDPKSNGDVGDLREMPRDFFEEKVVLLSWDFGQRVPIPVDLLEDRTLS